MDKPTLTKTGNAALEAILKGVNAIYEPVRMTLGPQGVNALLYRTFNRGSRITNDGKTIAQCIEPKDEFENLAATAFKEAAIRTDQRAGDGTTSTVVIAGKLLNDVFLKLLESSSAIRTKVAGGPAGVMTLKRQMLKEMEQVVEEVKSRAKKVESREELEKIATVSVEDPELGKIVAGIVWEIGVDGFVDLADGFKGDIETEIIKGMRFPAKPGAKAFVNNPAKFEMVAQDVDCIVTNYALDNAIQVGQFTKGLQTSKLAIFAPSFSENVLVNMVAAVKQGFFVYPIAVPSLRTEQFEDLAIYTGSTFINKDKGHKLEGIRQSDLGFAGKIVVKDSDAREDAAVIGGGGASEDVAVGDTTMKAESPVAKRIKTLQEQIDETKVEIHKKFLMKRIASMGSAVGIIRVGAPSEAEALYLKLKIEDAANACKGALQEGYVKGGGLCLKEIAESLPEDSILKTALMAPHEQIQTNAEGNLEIGDEIIDPAKVVRLSVEHAVSVVAHLSTAKVIVPEMREKGMNEGQEAIAQSLNLLARFYAKQQGLIKDNLKEMESDAENLRIFEEATANDTG